MPSAFRAIFVDKFKMKFSSERAVTHEAWPAGDRLANRTGTGAVATGRGERITQQIEEALGQPSLLAGGETDDPVEQGQCAPEGANPRQEHGETDAQGFHAEVVTGLQSPFHEQRLGDDEGRDFLHGGQRGVAVEGGGMAHLDFQFLEGDFLLPALRVEAEQFDRGMLAIFQQTGPETYDGAPVTPPADDAADFAHPELEWLTIVVAALDFDERAAIAKFLNEAGSEGGFDAGEEIAVVADKALEQGPQETTVTVEPIRQQQTMRRDAIDEPMGQGDFRIGTGADGQRQGIMEAEFHQQAGANLGEGGPSPSGTGFGELPANGWRVEHGKERAVNTDQQEVFVESMGMAAQRGPCAQDGVENGFENPPAQTLAAFGNRRAGKFDAGKLPAMRAVGSLGLEYVEDQQGEEEEGSEFGFTAFAGTELTQDAAQLPGAEILSELFEENTWATQPVQTFFSLFRGGEAFSLDGLPGWLERTGFLLHPDLKTKFLTFRKSKFNPVFAAIAASCRG